MYTCVYVIHDQYNEKVFKNINTDINLIHIGILNDIRYTLQQCSKTKKFPVRILYVEIQDTFLTMIYIYIADIPNIYHFFFSKFLCIIFSQRIVKTT